MQLEDVLGFDLLNLGNFQLQVIDLVSVIFILFIARLLVFLVKKYLAARARRGSLDEGRVYAVGQVLAYVIYIIAIIASIDAMGFKVTVLLASSTAILVGLGLGLQDTFRDMVAGFIILFERTVTAGDVVEIDGTVGRVKEVGLRTTTLITREEIILIVPNNKLTTERVINWSQNEKKTRFEVIVGVAYGSDTALVQKLLIEAAVAHERVLKSPEPFVAFRDFGDSSLDFSLYFFSNNLFRIERIKSDLRFKIDALFREHGVTIPFPQRDLWVKQFPQQDQ